MSGLPRKLRNVSIIALGLGFGAAACSSGPQATGDSAADRAAIDAPPSTLDMGSRTDAKGGSEGGSAGLGIPFGPYGAFATTTTLEPNTEVFTMATGSVTANNIIDRINAGRSKKVKLFLAMTGGAHENYMSIIDGVLKFDMAKWKTFMDTYNTATIKKEVAAAVADGTIVGNSVMDEPNVHGLGDGNTWGPIGTMTKARVDEMCAYVKKMFPTLQVGVANGHDAFEPDKPYAVCEFIIDQYSNRLGDVDQFISGGLALAQRDHHAIAFSMNILNGGIQAARDGKWNCPLTTTGGRGTYEPNCRMTAQQVRDYGKTLGVAGCAMTMWRYDTDFMANADNKKAFADVAALLATKPHKECRRP